MKSNVKTKILLACSALFLTAGVLLSAEEARSLSLNESIDLALRQNRLVSIMNYNLEKSQYKLKEVKSEYFPRLKFEGTSAYNSDPANLTIKKGEYSYLVDDLFTLPGNDIAVFEGDNFAIKSNIGLYQPLTQLINLGSAKDIAKIDIAIAETDLFRVKQEITYTVMELYYGILVLEKAKIENDYWLQYEEARYRDALNAFDVGKILKVDVISLEAEILDKKQELLKVSNRIDILVFKLNQLTGLPLQTKLKLNKPPLPDDDTELFKDYFTTAMENNPRTKAAQETVKKTEFAVTAAKKEYIPALSFFTQYYLDKGIPLTDDNYFLAGVKLSWDVFDFGKRKATIKQRIALKSQAEEEFERVKENTRTEIRKGFLDLTYARSLVQTALEVVELRRENLVITIQRNEVGIELGDTVIKARAELTKAKKELLEAELNARLILAKLEKIAGRLISGRK